MKSKGLIFSCQSLWNFIKPSFQFQSTGETIHPKMVMDDKAEVFSVPEEPKNPYLNVGSPPCRQRFTTSPCFKHLPPPCKRARH